jgi:hypothetical protein
MGDTTKKKMKLNMPLEEFAKLTPEEKAEYKRQGDEMSKKTKDAYKKTKEAPFNTGGGVLKAAPNKGAASLPKGVRNSMGFMKKGGKVKGYEHGGSVKGKKMNKCRMDGIAIRGKTRAKQRSK